MRSVTRAGQFLQIWSEGLERVVGQPYRESVASAPALWTLLENKMKKPSTNGFPMLRGHLMA